MKNLPDLRLILLFCFAPLFLFSQNTTSENEPACGSDDLLQHLKTTQPGFAELIEQTEKALYDYHHSAAAKPAGNDPQTLPVVVHIIHNNGPENLSDARIHEAMVYLNEAFANAGYFGNLGSSADVPFRFCLAQRDPDGMPTTGITRTVSTLTNMVQSTENIALKNLVRWNPRRYINVWVVSSIKKDTDDGLGLAGYATLPFSHGSSNDGIVMAAEYVGSPTLHRNIVFPHEMGHYLGLYHTFQGGCLNDDCETQGDRVCDTPPDQATFSTCSGFNSCSTDANAPAPNPFVLDANDMTENFMDYSAWTCMYRFSEGQSERMASMTNFFRTSLVNSTGCLEACLSGTAAAFSTSGTEVSTGDTLWFTNQSQNASSYAWVVNGQVVSNATDFMFVPTVEGTFKIRLDVFGPTPNCLDNKSVDVQVSCNIGGGLLAANFETTAGATMAISGAVYPVDQFLWTVNGIVAGSDSVLTYTFSNTGNYTVELTATNTYCSRVFAQSVVVYPYCETLAPDQWSIRVTSMDAFNCATATNGDVIISGASYRPVITRTTPEGGILWAKSLTFQQDTVYQNHVMFLSPDQENGFYSATKNTGILQRWDASGNVLWSKRIDTTSYGTLFAKALDVFPDGHVLYVGSWPNFKDHIVKLDADGNMVWRKQLSDTSIVQSATVCPDGSILVGMLVQQNGDFFRRAIAKLSTDGELLWLKQYDAENELPNDPDDLKSVMPEADGGFSMCIYRLSAQQYNSILVRCNADGSVRWSKRYLFPSVNFSTYSNFVFCTKAQDGGFLLSTYRGLLENNIGSHIQYFTRLDADGEVDWTTSTHTFGSLGSLTYGALGPSGTEVHDGWLFPINQSAVLNSIYLMHTNQDGFAGGCADTYVPASAENHTTTVQDLVGALQNNVLFELDSCPYTLIETGITRYVECAQIPPCAEHCSNQGIDDDNDGYPDCYDAQCACWTTPDCAVTKVFGPDSARLAWSSGIADVNVACVPMVANLNPNDDDVPEIMVVRAPLNGTNSSSRLYTYSGDGSNKTQPGGFFTSVPAYPAIPPVIGDLDGDNNTEVVVLRTISSSQHYINTFTDYTPGANPSMAPEMESLSTFNLGLNTRKPQLADFNGDGLPEVYAGLRVESMDTAQNNFMMRIKPPSNTPHGQLAFNNYQYTTAQTVAAELLTRGQCNGDKDCDGPEIAAGPAIYSVDLDGWDGDPGEVVIRRNLNDLDGSNSVWGDGYTAVADINNDNISEVIVAGKRDNQHCVYAWNINGLVRIFNYPVTTPLSGGMPCIANVFDDRTMGFTQDFPEIIVASSNRLTCFNLNAANGGSGIPYWWSITTTDSTGFTGATAFDFNADGYDEIVYQDRTHLRILYGGITPLPDGVDAQRNWFKFPAPTVTADQYPVVADCDGDGEAEIIFTSFDAGGPDSISPLAGRLRVLESAGLPWPAARPIWNQYTYTPYGVNEDLTIPAEPLAPWRPFGNMGKRPFNRVLSQTTSLNAQFDPYLEAADASVTIDSAWCSDEQLHLRLLVCNNGVRVLPAHTPLRVYRGNPTTGPATAWTPETTLDTTLFPGACLFYNLIFPVANNADFFVVINADSSMAIPFSLVDDYSPRSTYECDYTNNIAGISWSWNTPALNLGPDVEACTANAVSLDAGAGFAQYLWSDGSNERLFTAPGPGAYWVEVWDFCGYRQSDTVHVLLSDIGFLDLGPEQAVCPGESVTLSAPGFDQVFWTPGIFAGGTITFAPAQTLLVYATGVTGDCIATDSVRIVVRDVPVLGFDVIPAQGSAANGAVTVYATGGMAPYQFLWNTGHTLDSLSGLAPGWYSVTVTDSAGCLSVSQVYVGQTTSTHQPGEGPAMAVMPNPTDAFFQVLLTGGEQTPGTCTVVNALGQTMDQRTFRDASTTTLTFPCASWPSGTYEVIINLKSIIYTEKVVVGH